MAVFAACQEKLRFLNLRAIRLILLSSFRTHFHKFDQNHLRTRAQTTVSGPRPDQTSKQEAPNPPNWLPMPLLEAGIVERETLIADAKSGVST